MNPSITSPRKPTRRSLHTAAGKPVTTSAQKVLLFCGVLSSAWYFFMNIFVVTQYEGYNVASQTVSELSAVDAPTRALWVALGYVYTLLFIAFGLGVWQWARGKGALRTVGGLMVLHGIVGAFWPPMHQREVLAAGGGTLTDTLHIVFTMITGALMLAAMVFAAKAFKNGFRIYSILTMVVLLVFGILTGLDAPEMEANLPTPWLGVVERIGIAAFMLWVVVLSIKLLRRAK